MLNSADNDSYQNLNKYLLNHLSPENPSKNNFNINQERQHTEPEDEVDVGDTSFHKDLSSYGAGSGTSSLGKSFGKQV